MFVENNGSAPGRTKTRPVFSVLAGPSSSALHSAPVVRLQDSPALTSSATLPGFWVHFSLPDGSRTLSQHLLSGKHLCFFFSTGCHPISLRPPFGRSRSGFCTGPETRIQSQNFRLG